MDFKATYNALGNKPMGRDIPYDEEVKCDSCGKVGAFDFMGDCYCDDWLFTCEECEVLFVEINTSRRKFCVDCSSKALTNN